MTRSPSLKRLLALMLIAVLFFAACGDDGDDDDGTAQDGDTTTTAAAGDGETIALAFVGPLTGPNAALGVNIRNGAKVAIEEANEEGGDYNFVLKEFDTQGDPAQAPTVKDKYINDDEIVGVVGPTFSGETKAVLPDLSSAPLVMISASATNVDLPNEVPDGKSFHRLVPDDDVQGEGVADYVTEVLEAGTAFYIHDNTDYGKGVADGTQAILEDAGVDTAGSAAIDPRSQDYSSAVNSAKAAGADVIFYGGYYAEAGRLAKQLKDAGVDAKFMSGDGSLDPGFVESAGADGAEGAVVTCACRIASEDAEGELGEFATKYKEVNDGAAAGTYSTEGYDAAKILIEGIKAGNDTREALIDYVEGLGAYEGISKAIEFEDNGNIKAGDVYVYEFKGGKIEELGTVEELAA
jgi:branched-chain amino acid transport system substrate-binding protein